MFSRISLCLMFFVSSLPLFATVGHGFIEGDIFRGHDGKGVLRTLEIVSIEQRDGFPKILVKSDAWHGHKIALSERVQFKLPQDYEEDHLLDLSGRGPANERISFRLKRDEKGIYQPLYLIFEPGHENERSFPTLPDHQIYRGFKGPGYDIGNAKGTWVEVLSVRRETDEDVFDEPHNPLQTNVKTTIRIRTNASKDLEPIEVTSILNRMRNSYEEGRASGSKPVGKTFFTRRPRSESLQLNFRFTPQEGLELISMDFYRDALTRILLDKLAIGRKHTRCQLQLENLNVK